MCFEKALKKHKFVLFFIFFSDPRYTGCPIDKRYVEKVKILIEVVKLTDDKLTKTMLVFDIFSL